jgi:group I intron endonuclease
MILEYYNFTESTNNEQSERELLKNLLARETFWITKLKPSYNLAPTAYGTFNYKYTDETKKKMSEANYNANNPISDQTRFRMSSFFFKKFKTDPNIRDIISLTNSKPVKLLDDKKNYLRSFKGVRALSKYLGCCHKTVNKAIKNKT